MSFGIMIIKSVVLIQGLAATWHCSVFIGMK